MPIKSRSPGVVGIGKNPRRSMEGDTVCQIVIAITVKKIVPQKIAVGKVHSIHFKVNVIVKTPLIDDFLFPEIVLCC